MSSKHLAASLLFLSACIVSNPFNRGDGETGETGEETASGEDMGDGDPQTGDGDGDPQTGDGDPQTGDGDPQTGDGDPQTGDGDGDPQPGDGDGDPLPGCERMVWEFNFNNETWISTVLDVAWTGANAPPCDVEIWATTYVESSDQLLVFAANGQYYRRKNGTWDPPVAISMDYPQLNGLELESMVYVPAVNGQPASLLINSLPNAYLYEIEPNGLITYGQTVPIMDEPNGGPPQSTSDRFWAMTLADAQLWGTAAWWHCWQGFDNNLVYFVDGAFTWDNWDEDNNRLFGNNGNEPDPNKVEAGWGDHDLQRGYLIARL